MSKSKSVIIAGLDAFTESYIETALWSSTYDDGKRPLEDDFYIDNLTVACLLEMVRDCRSFQKHSELWECDEQAGHDFWLTRNGHGAGFWDGDYSLHGTELTELSKPYGSVNLMPYRGKIYC
jgi:hypothetical protein